MGDADGYEALFSDSALNSPRESAPLKRSMTRADSVKHFGVSEEDFKARVAAGKCLSILMKMEVAGHCTVEKQSVYGAVIALPQIARSVGWSRTMTGLSLRAFLFLC